MLKRKIKEDKEIREGDGYLDWVVRKGFSKEVIFEMRPK